MTVPSSNDSDDMPDQTPASSSERCVNRNLCNLVILMQTCFDRLSFLTNLDQKDADELRRFYHGFVDKTKALMCNADHVVDKLCTTPKANIKKTIKKTQRRTQRRTQRPDAVITKPPILDLESKTSAFVQVFTERPPGRLEEFTYHVSLPDGENKSKMLQAYGFLKTVRKKWVHIEEEQKAQFRLLHWFKEPPCCDKSNTISYRSLGAESTAKMYQNVCCFQQTLEWMERTGELPMRNGSGGVEERQLAQWINRFKTDKIMQKTLADVFTAADVDKLLHKCKDIDMSRRKYDINVFTDVLDFCIRHKDRTPQWPKSRECRTLETLQAGSGLCEEMEEQARRLLEDRLKGDEYARTREHIHMCITKCMEKQRGKREYYGASSSTKQPYTNGFYNGREKNEAGVVGVCESVRV